MVGALGHGVYDDEIRGNGAQLRPLGLVDAVPVAERDDVRLAQVERGVAQRVERFEHHALEARTCVLGLSTVLLGLGQVGARGLEAPNQKGGWGGGLSAGCEYRLSISLRLIRGSLVWSWAVGRSASALCLGGAGQTVA